MYVISKDIILVFSVVFFRIQWSISINYFYYIVINYKIFTNLITKLQIIKMTIHYSKFTIKMYITVQKTNKIYF